ncbi:MAG: phosphotransferase, partial [Firmicutes bacterium]|nr:phosphotransferase [Candidatus Colivicinus equi]
MNSKFENNELTIFVQGTVDTSNAEQFGEEVATIRAKHPDCPLIFDCDELTYISSAGLRQILKVKKANKDFKIINANSQIYEIFEMTGFTEMIDIHKAYRKIDVSGCEKIGEGSNGIVYRLNADTIIKVYKNNDALEDIKRERELARTALVMGINTAIPYDVVKVDDKYGSVFEMLDNKSITKWIKADPDNIEKYINLFVDMLKEIHNTIVKPGVLPSEKEVVLKWVTFLKDYIDEEHYNKLRSLVEEVPESDHMLHGDYHTGNVHWDMKESILIDMDTICVGNPIFEFGSIYNAFEGYGLTDEKRVSK